MKRNAIVRIILYSVTVVLLIAILIGGLTETFPFFGSGKGIPVDCEASIEAVSCREIEINWASGSVVIKREDVPKIIFRETASDTIRHSMTYRFSDGTLELNYSGQKFAVNASQEKDLVIVVPLDWKAQSIEINGADLTVDIIDLTVDELEIETASSLLNFRGSVDKVSIDATSVKAKLQCGNRVSEIDMDGTGCSLELILPKECGFLLEMDGLGCDFHSELAGIAQNGSYHYGDQHCKIEVNGMNCNVSIHEDPIWPI